MKNTLQFAVNCWQNKERRVKNTATNSFEITRENRFEESSHNATALLCNST
jgi:hypothetical protein